MPIEQVQTLIIGGGQAGLVMSHSLKARGLPHLVLERHRIAERWRSERWDGLRFQFPNWSVRLPDFPFPHDDPDGFATTGEILDYITAYADFIAPPIRCGVAVTRLRTRDGGSGFIVETSDGAIEAGNVVVATGPYQRSIIPDVLRDHASLFQVHASRYFNPEQLPPGAVLVVGAGASGAQIAEELLRAGRRVYLSVGKPQPAAAPLSRSRPDVVDEQTGSAANDTGAARPEPALSRDIGRLWRPHRRFSPLRGRRHDAARAARHRAGRRHAISHPTSPKASQMAMRITPASSTWRTLMSRTRPRHAAGSCRARGAPDPRCVADPIRRLDHRGCRHPAVIWATGYGVDFGWIDMAVFDSSGEPVIATASPSYPDFISSACNGCATINSSFLSGVGDDAAHLADHIAARNETG